MQPVPLVPRPALYSATLTAIRATGGRLCKRWSGPRSKPVCESYGYGYWHTLYDVRSRPRNVHMLALELEALAGQSDVCVVRGGLNPGQQLCVARNPLHPFRRTLENFQESPTASWLCLDFDSPPPAPFSAFTDPQDYALNCAIGFGLQGIPLAYQLSGSCGIKHRAGIHFWGLLSRPLPGPILSRWYASLGADSSLAGIVQPHYTAAPQFAPAPILYDPADREYDGQGPDPDWIHDPIPAGRTGSFNWGKDAVVDADAIEARFKVDVDREREALILKERGKTHNATLSRLNRSGPAPEHSSSLQLAEKAGIVTDYDGPDGATRCACPRHDSDSKVSLHINADGEGWYCFGCRGGGGAWELASWILEGRLKRFPSRAEVVACLKGARS